MMAANCKRIGVTHVAMIYVAYWSQDAPVWKTTLAANGLKNMGIVVVEDTAALPGVLTKLIYDTARSNSVRLCNTL